MIWEPEYSVNLEELDAQHRYFVRLLDRIEVASNARQESKLTAIVHELERYTRYHFATENALMTAYGYDGASHRAEHAKILTHLDSVLSDANFRPAALRLFLYKWLVVHIQLEDSVLANYVAERRAALFPEESEVIAPTG